MAIKNIKGINTGQTRKWKIIPRFWTGRINVTKMSILHKATGIFNAITIKIPRTGLEKSMLKYVNIRDLKNLKKS